MASPELAITKAALSASLFRADPTSISRPDVEDFFKLCNAAVARCSRPNVQKCRSWIVSSIVPSSARSVALGKYLVALAKNYEDDGSRPSSKRRRLHLLYLLNDVFHHAVARRGDTKAGKEWDGALPSLVASAASFSNCPKHMKKLEGLINLWEEKRYFSPILLSQLREAMTTGQAAGEIEDTQASSTSLKIAKDAPYIIPSIHGDHATQWYDLPVATWLPHLTPNSTKPMLPELIQPIQLAAGPADKTLANAVQNLLADVNRLYTRGSLQEEESLFDLNELGERVILDETTKEIVDGETYYGWSRGFCEKMKQRRRGGPSRDSRSPRSRSRSSSYSRSRSRSGSAPAFKRRRVSSSRGSSRSPSRSPRRRRYRGRSSSPSPSRSRSRSRSPTPRRSRSPRRSYSRSRTRSPRRESAPLRPPYPAVPPPPPHLMNPGSLALPPPPPPPPPAGYQGPWPPPPPPPLMAGGNGPPPNWMPLPGNFPPEMMAALQAGQAPPPPLPPPPGYPPYQQGYGARGNGGYRGRGRGGYDRGRGRW